MAEGRLGRPTKRERRRDRGEAGWQRNRMRRYADGSDGAREGDRGERKRRRPWKRRRMRIDEDRVTLPGVNEPPFHLPFALLSAVPFSIGGTPAARGIEVPRKFICMRGLLPVATRERTPRCPCRSSRGFFFPLFHALVREHAATSEPVGLEYYSRTSVNSSDSQRHRWR